MKPTQCVCILYPTIAKTQNYFQKNKSSIYSFSKPKLRMYFHTKRGRLRQSALNEENTAGIIYLKFYEMS